MFPIENSLQTQLKNVNGLDDETIKKINEGLGTYGDQGGHHPMAKSAFEGVDGYDYKQQLTASDDLLKYLEVSHPEVTGKQLSGYKEFIKTGKELTMDAMRNIEIKALVDAGMQADIATYIVDKAIEALKAVGITSPIRIPWGR